LAGARRGENARTRGAPAAPAPAAAPAAPAMAGADEPWAAPAAARDEARAMLRACGASDARSRRASARVAAAAGGPDEFTDLAVLCADAARAADWGRFDVLAAAPRGLQPGSAHAAPAGIDEVRARREDSLAKLGRAARAGGGGGGAGGLRCRKCGSDSVAVQQKQTRSADEGMTVFCSCEQCGFHWRMA